MFRVTQPLPGGCWLLFTLKDSALLCPLEDVLRTISFWRNFGSTYHLEGVDSLPVEVYSFIVSSAGCIIRVVPLEECVEPENIWRVLVPFSSTGLCNLMSSGGCTACFFLWSIFIGGPNPWRMSVFSLFRFTRQYILWKVYFLQHFSRRIFFT